MLKVKYISCTDKLVKYFVEPNKNNYKNTNEYYCNNDRYHEEEEEKKKKMKKKEKEKKMKKRYADGDK